MNCEDNRPMATSSSQAVEDSDASDQNAALILEEQGCEVFAVADVFGGIIRRDGRPLPIKKLVVHVKKTGSVIMFPDTEPITNEDLLLLECDVLVPAAMECVLHRDNALKVKAKVIAEAANLPTTPEGDEIFARRGIVVLPDILTNIGGVVVSYFEWTQNLQQSYWDEREVNRRLYSYIEAAYRNVASLAAAQKITFNAQLTNSHWNV